MTLPDSLNHPQRLQLASEVHARPFMVVEAPAQVTHVAIFAGDDHGLHHHALERLCRRFGVAPAAADAKHFSQDLGVFRLKWENHTEFSTYTFVVDGPFERPFAAPPSDLVPADWLHSLGATVLAATQLALERGGALAPGDARLRSYFPGSVLVGSRVVNGAELWTDFRVGPDGYSRFLLRDTGLREMQSGRLIQRVCEIETYRMMALLALPLARETLPRISQLERELAAVTQRMVGTAVGSSDHDLLETLTGIAARIEALNLLTDYRFGAALAYDSLVRARIAELREERIEGVPTVGEFMERRLLPAMDTCQTAAARQENLAARVARSNDLLRTRVNIAQEAQNQAVLQSLNRNAGMQVRLQQAVEGLSVVAISYYLVALLGYGFKALKGLGLPLNVDLAVGAAIPLACAATWLGLRSLHRKVSAKGA
jgi:uncharacterized membrane-anchored protein